MDIAPFKVEVPDDALEDLHDRLVRTRWPDELEGTDWDYGSNMAYVKELVDYWINEFDWRAQERTINSFSQFKTEIDGQGIHFVHERGKGPNPFPLLITHGWPSSFVEFQKIIPLLTDPASHGGDEADSFDVITPSMPGYGFSAMTSRREMHTEAFADLWVKLMTEGLSYDAFGVQGGDWGATVSSWQGYKYPQHVKGVHLNAIFGPRPYLGPGSRPLSDAEEAYLEEMRVWEREEGAYGHIQGTKPQTLAYGLNDSPVGLAAWIVEKWRAWSDCDGDLEKRYTKDELLTNITVYWVTQTINSSVRLYYEDSRHPWNLEQGDRLDVPVGVSVFPVEIDHPIREWAERSLNVQQWTEMPKGGHFPSIEEPELLAEDVRKFFRSLR